MDPTPNRSVTVDETRARLLELLAEQGITPKDWEQVELARAIIAKVNKRLAKRNSASRFSVVSASDPLLVRQRR